jgi:DNA polymerase (family 10)
MENTQISSIFNKIADLVELKGGNQFRVRSYRNAARTVSNMSQRLEELVRQGVDLTEYPNIGKSTAEKIQEIVERGTCQRLEELEREIPQGLTELMQVPRLGAKKVAQLHQELSIESLEDLKKAAEQGAIRDLEGMGQKTEQTILEGIRMLDATSDRVLYHVAEEYVHSLGQLLDQIDAVNQWEVAGSFRRGKETVGDLDVLVQAGDREAAAHAVLTHESIEDVVSRGQEKITVHMKGGLQLDVRFFEPESFGAALAYFTGSKAHNIALRKHAAARDWKLNEYGLFKDDQRLAGKTEASVYHRLNLPWIPPELREDRGELEAAESDTLPSLIEQNHIRGDLHAHTKLTDGKHTLEEMVDAARNRGYEYLAITEHSRAVTVAGGLDEDQVRKHADTIREVNEKISDFWILAGIEVDILKSGKLDLAEKTLADLDWVVASVHSYFKLNRDDMTDRLLAAVRSGVVHCLGHPTDRMIGKRDPITFDVERVVEACTEHKVCLEINSQPDRLDLPDFHCRRVRHAGVRFAMVTDAHSNIELDFMRYGILVARRGWLEKGHVINTKTARQLEAWLSNRSRTEDGSTG